MKPPLTVEARVAEELRTWLASELEQLEASNTNQFAHHVVTILLHEDLDLEDEPRTSGDDFLKEIYSIKQGKTKDKQKKAAVQFIRDAVCSEVQVKEIQGVVDELMVRIDQMKLKMNSRKESKRSLLAPIAINIDNPVRHTSIKSDGSEEERYNEAFPSLSGEDSPCKDTPSRPACTDSVWNGGGGKENKDLKQKRKSPGKQYTPTQAALHFTSPLEAETCTIACKAAALVLGESAVPKQAAEVSRRSRLSTSGLRSCWKSAFVPTSYKVLYVPLKIKLKSNVVPEPNFEDKVFSPFILEKDYSKLNQSMHVKSVEASDTVLPPKEERALERDDPGFIESLPISEEDKEVFAIYLRAKKLHKKKTEQIATQERKKAEALAKSKQLENHLSFPDHHGQYWNKMMTCGLISLYPKTKAYAAVEHPVADKFGSDEKAQTDEVSSDSEEEIEEIELFTRSLEDLIDTGLRCSSDNEIIKSGPSSCYDMFAKSKWDEIRENFWQDVEQYRERAMFLHLLNNFMPSQLSSCVSSEGDQLLQSAFVNAIFASKDMLDDSHLSFQQVYALNCSDVEEYMYSLHTPSAGPQRELVKGQTCSGWLEDSCFLGQLCPFSHPSI